MQQTLSLQSGQIFAERYRVIRSLGVGGMGEVYLAQDTLLNNTEIALKFLSTNLSKDEKQIQRFLREVLLTRQVSHENVVKTYDAGLVDGQLYFVMEYLEGHELKTLINEKKLNLEQIINYLIQIAKGLAAIHKAEIIHRDLKPANILITKSGLVKIADFGVAKPENSELTNVEEVIGSSHYMAPEAWKGDKVSSKSDLYSLGIIAYQMITGEVPYDGTSAAQIMFKHMEGIVPNPRSTNPDCPKWFSKIIYSLLALDPLDRPDLEELIEKLQNAGETKSNSMPQKDISNQGLGYQSSGLLNKEDQLGIWDPVATISFQQNKTLANPNFGEKNLIKVSFRHRLRKLFGNDENQKTSLLDSLICIAIGATLAWLIVNVIADSLNQFLNQLFIANKKSDFPILLKILPNIILTAGLVATPGLIVGGLSSSWRIAIKKYFILFLSSLLIILVIGLVYTTETLLLKNDLRLINYALAISLPRAFNHVIESMLLLPIGSIYELTFIKNIPTLKEISLAFNPNLAISYLSLISFVVSLKLLIAPKVRKNKSAVKLTIFATVLFLLVLGVEILTYYYLSNNSSAIIVRTEYDWSVTKLKLSNFQLYCSLINWSLILLITQGLKLKSEKVQLGK